MRRPGLHVCRLPLLLSTAIAAGCAGIAAGSSGNDQTGTGGSAGGCQTIGCVPPVASALTFAVEITPPVGSGAPLTEMPSVHVGGGSPANLVTDMPSPVTATFIAASGGTVPGNANIVLDIPSQIPGRRDLTFQAPATTGTDPMSGRPTSTAQLGVPLMLLGGGSMATLSLLPLAPDDQQTPPYVTSLPLNTAGQLAFQLPSDNVSVSGKLHNSVDKVPSTPFVARAFQGASLVSSAPTIASSDGSFTLMIPSAAAQAGNSVTIQLTPQTQTDPWFIFTPFQLPAPPFAPISLGTVMLAAYTPVSLFNVIVQGTDQSRVSGAVVSAQTSLGSSTSSNMYSGTTSFARTVVANSDGTAALSLIPASGNYTGAYDLVAVPPAGSLWATSCLLGQKAQIPVNGGGVNVPGAPTLATFTLNPRPVLTGRVTDSNGRGVANVAITATPGGDPTGNCPSTPAAPGKTTTDGTGVFKLPLDPGVYQLDYDPPPGSAAPRYMETGVSVSGTSPVGHDRTLPAGGLVSGTVATNSGALLPSATVKLFQPQCTGVSSPPCSPPPLLVGQGVTDANGRFQIVVPVNQ